MIGIEDIIYIKNEMRKVSGGGSIITITDPEGDFEGDTVTATKGAYSKSAVVHDGKAVIKGFEETGTVVITATDFEGSINITSFNSYSLELTLDPRVWGFYENFNILDNDPTLTSPRISYPEYYQESADVKYKFINYNYEPMHIRDEVYMEPGDFEYFLHSMLKNYPYMVNSTTKQANYQLDSMDYSKRVDGTASDFSNASYVGGPFSWMSLPYFKEVYVNDGSYGGRYVMWSWDSRMKTDYGFSDIITNPNNQSLKGIWLPMGFTTSSGHLNGGGTPATNLDQATAKSTVELLTSDAKTLGGPIFLWISDLLYMLFKTCNITKYAGYGLTKYDMSPNYGYPNQNIKGDGYTSTIDSTIRTFDLHGTGSQGTSNVNKKIAGKHFHSQVLGSFCQSLVDGWLRGYTNGVLQITKNGVDFSDIIRSDNVTKGSWRYPIKRIQTISGSIKDFTNNNASNGTGACSSYFWATDATSSYYLIWVMYAGSNALGLMNSMMYANNGKHKQHSVATMLLPPVDYEPSIVVSDQ